MNSDLERGASTAPRSALASRTISLASTGRVDFRPGWPRRLGMALEGAHEQRRQPAAGQRRAQDDEEIERQGAGPSSASASVFVQRWSSPPAASRARRRRQAPPARACPARQQRGAACSSEAPGLRDRTAPRSTWPPSREGQRRRESSCARPVNSGRASGAAGGVATAPAGLPSGVPHRDIADGGLGAAPDRRCDIAGATRRTPRPAGHSGPGSGRWRRRWSRGALAFEHGRPGPGHGCGPAASAAARRRRNSRRSG